MDLHLKDKVVFISGSTSGIGKAAAEVFLKEGAIVCINGRKQETVDACVAELKAISDKVYGYPCDVSKEDEVIPAFAKIAEDHGCLDILVNNAGIITDSELIDMSLDLWHKIFAVNLDSMLICSKEAVKYMKRERKPVILNAASVTAEWPTMGNGAYSISKGAIINFTKVLCGELARKGIRVMGYLPGMTRTPINDEVFRKEPERITAQIPFRRIAEPEEIGSVVAFLASDQASYMAGSMAIIDGGKLTVQNPRRYDGHLPVQANL